MFRAANFEFDNKKFKTGEFPEQNGEREAGRETEREFQERVSERSSETEHSYRYLQACGNSLKINIFQQFFQQIVPNREQTQPALQHSNQPCHIKISTEIQRLFQRCHTNFERFCQNFNSFF